MAEVPPPHSPIPSGPTDYHGLLPGPPGTVPPPYRHHWNRPEYDIGFMAAYRRGWSKYARFDGRAARREYWWWTLANAAILFVLLILILAILTYVGGPREPDAASWVFLLLSVLLTLAWVGYWVAALIPSLALTSRRLHDTGRSAWWMLLALVPVVGVLVLLALLCLAPGPEGVKYDRTSSALPA